MSEWMIECKIDNRVIVCESDESAGVVTWLSGVVSDRMSDSEW